MHSVIGWIYTVLWLIKWWPKLGTILISSLLLFGKITANISTNLYYFIFSPSPSFFPYLSLSRSLSLSICVCLLVSSLLLFHELESLYIILFFVISYWGTKYIFFGVTLTIWYALYGGVYAETSPLSVNLVQNKKS